VIFLRPAGLIRQKSGARVVIQGVVGCQLRALSALFSGVTLSVIHTADDMLIMRMSIASGDQAIGYILRVRPINVRFVSFSKDAYQSGSGH
jgi:hypothetical protein|tara:strand:+ start:38 stop:310 length:273 start_codon:yes stop_codon:yes gene_type:complete